MHSTLSPGVGSYLDTVISIRNHHAADDPLYRCLKEVIRDDMAKIFGQEGPCEAYFSGIGNIILPYKKMGAVESVNLFDIDELIIFSFYRANKANYINVLDIGCNIGLHSIIMSKIGFNVTAFEPDPEHCSYIKKNLQINNVSNFSLIQAAVSDKKERREFVRVLGNTTGSHLSGAKNNPYGDLDRFNVDVLPFNDLLDGVDLVKLDAEGEEARILCSTNEENWISLDALIEVGNEENANQIWNHFKNKNINLFSQKINWQQVESLADIPTSYKEGTLFITSKPSMPWMCE